MKQRIRSLAPSTAAATAIFMLLVSCVPTPEDAFADGPAPCAVEESGSSAPISAPIPPGEGGRDWERVDGGDVSGEDIGHLLANLQQAGLDSDQLRAPQNGESVADLPGGALTYLEEFYGSAGLRGISNLQSALATTRSPEACAARRALSVGLLTLSNESVSDASSSGAVSRLPASLRPSVNPTFGMTRIWSTVAETTDMPPGDGLGISMIRVASALARAGVGGGAPQILLDIGARNRESVLRTLSGDLDGNSTAEVNPANILNPLFTNDWEDDGTSVGTLVDWMSEESDAGLAVAMRERAGEAAYALSDYLTDANVYGRLMDVDGKGTRNLGEANSVLVASLARGLSRYVPQIVDTAGAQAVPGWPADEPELYATRISTLMATGEDSSRSLHATATAIANQSVDSYLDSIQRDPTDPDLSAAYDAGRIHALRDLGPFRASAEQTADDKSREVDAYEMKERFYSSAVAAAGPLLGGLAAIAKLSATVPGLRPSFIGKPPEQSELWSQVYSWKPEDARVAGLARLLTQTIRRDESFDPRKTRLAEFFSNGRTDLTISSSRAERARFGEAAEYVLGEHYAGADLRAYTSFYSDGFGSIAPILRDTGIPIRVTVR